MKDRHIYLLFILLTFLLHWGNLTGGYFSDDFSMFFPKGGINPFSLFVSVNPYEPTVYRPLAGFYNSAVQYFFGTNAFPIHLMNLLLHGVIACVPYKFMGRLGMSKSAAVTGGVIFIVSQSTVTATLRNCTMTQQMSCLCWLMFLYVLYFSDGKGAGLHLKLCGIYFLGLLSKETSLAIVPGAAVLFFWVFLRQGGSVFKSLKQTAVALLPYVLITGIYFAVRVLIGVPIFLSEGRGSFSFGFGMIVNLILLAFSNINLFSSTDVFYSFTAGNYIFLGAAVIVDVLVAAVVCAGVIKAKKIKTAAVLVLLMVISYFPTVMMPHVSELYGYSALPLLCVIYAIGLEYFLRQGKPLKFLSVSVFVIIILVNAASVQRKALMLNQNANTAANLISQLQELVNEYPSGTRVYLINTDEDGLRYSYGNFHMTDAETLKYAGADSFHYFLGRDDISFAYRELDGAKNLPSSADAVLLTVTNGTLVPY